MIWIPSSWPVWRRNNAARDDAPIDALPIGSLVGDEHEITGYLGSGGFGYTYLARRFDGHQVALKECFPFEFCRRNGLEVGLKAHDLTKDFEKIRNGFHEEAAILSEFQHPNIVAGGLLISAYNTVYIEMDQVHGTPLIDHLNQWFRRPSKKQTKQIGRDVLNALETIHAKGYLHKDISPDNIIINKQGAPVLIDFGSAAPISNTPSDDPMLVVKIGYSPQEFYRAGAKVGPASDLYQLAATLRHCATGRRPVESVSRLHARAQGKPDPLPALAHKRSKHRAFFTSIDDAMAVLIDDRIATAQQWLDTLGDP
jgi:serine/threonine protein kinase